VRAVFRKAGSILSGSQDVTRGRVKTLDWRPRGGREGPQRRGSERLGGQKRWGRRVSDPLCELRAAQRTPDTVFRGSFAAFFPSLLQQTHSTLSETGTEKRSAHHRQTINAPPPCYMPSTNPTKATREPKPFGPHPKWSKKDLHEWSLSNARANLQDSLAWQHAHRSARPVE